ncbi:MAG TPA: hypothetical protein VIF88_04720 [Methylocystis sp.]|jgi:antitoxin (DNA-binding transcriptional repressor) of toxin-antitoxin stability system
MPETVDVSEAEARFDELVAEVETGATFVICRDGIPLVRLVPVHAEGTGAAPQRKEYVPQEDDGRR